jgi:integrase
VTQADVAAARSGWVNQRKGPRKGAPLSAAASNIALGILREAFGPLGRRGLVSDPTADVKRRRKATGSAVYLTADQAKALLAAIAGDPLELLVKVALAVGPRRGEILGMRWGDLDLAAGTWTAGLQLRYMPPEARREGEGPYRLVEPKAGHSIGRVVSLPAFLTADLTDHRKAQRAIRRRAPVWVKPGDLVFCDDMGQALPPGSVTRRFEQLAKRALGMHLRLHDLRHSAATIMLAMGVQERVVQDILGHSSGATTRGYTHVVRTLGEDAARRMDDAMATRMPASNG